MSAEIMWPDLPLVELFTRLRLAGLPLGIDEYQLLIHALQRGFGMLDRAALVRLCKTLWIKSAEEEDLFDYHFEDLFPISDEKIPFSTESTVSERSNSQPPTSLPGESESPLIPSVSKQSGTSTLTASSKLVLTFGDDETQIAQALRNTFRGKGTFEEEPVPQTDEYFPITRRQMKQAWRYLRRPQRQGPAVELDIEATVNKVARTGVLFEPVLIARRINRAVLFLFIDQGGSMVPFHMLSQRLAETAVRGGRLGQTNIFYFHNCPINYLYHDPFQFGAETLQNVLARLHVEHAMVLIFSDAGAARGALNEARIYWTVQFLEKLKHHVRSIAWLNPMPRSRWLGTTAGEIMQLVPMLDVSRQGLDYTINVLRGRPAPYSFNEMRV